MTMANFGQIISVYLLLLFTQTCSSQQSSAWFKLAVSGMFRVYQKQIISIEFIYGFPFFIKDSKSDKVFSCQILGNAWSLIIFVHDILTLKYQRKLRCYWHFKTC